jgi:hypothetical protein
VMAGVSTFDGGSSSFRPGSTNLNAGSILVAEWSDGMPLVAIKCINGHPRVDLGFFPVSSDATGTYWQSSTDGALLMANALNYVANPPDSDGDGIPDTCDTPSVHNLTQGTDHFRIQEAIDLAVNGDEIHADPGTYHEAINFNGLAITLRSASGNSTDTIIDGTGNFQVVRCANGEGPDTILEGFTITGGNANGGFLSDRGGGMFNDNSSPTVTNCAFSGNSAVSFGGGMYNDDSSPTVTNCAFSGNTAGSSGGGMFNDNSSSSTVTNCILWGDSPDEIANTGSGTSTVSFSDVQGGLPVGTNNGGGNIDANPLFVNAAGGNLRLLGGSPCIDTGNNAAIPAGITTDLDGNPRVRNVTVDMGAYELGDRVHNLNQNTYYSNIQPAIVAAANGQMIEVESGTYHEAINFLGKAITVRSASGNPNDTIIDGTGNLHVVQCVTGEGSNTVLSGFTITGGNANVPGPIGSNGGGMYNEGASPTVTNCIFRGNIAAIGRGAGMHNAPNSSPTVTNCTFSGNTSYLGGGMSNIDSGATVTNCVFIGNTATNGGGGMFNELNTLAPTVTNCAFSGNTAGSSGGGGIYNYSSSPTVINCIFWGDLPNEIINDVSTPTVRFSDLQGGLPAGTIDGGGNLDLDPLFVDADGADNTTGTADDDLRLLAGSPCIDSATYFDFDTIFDLDGKDRYVDDPTIMNTGTGVWTFLDRGAYEFQVPPCSGIPGDINCDGVVNLLDLALLAANWLKTTDDF